MIWADLFGGFGGATAGILSAGGTVAYAADHWELAVRVHSDNHPSVKHECQDLCQADFAALPAFEALWASPACQGHSTGSQPRRRAYHDAMRGTAWAVVHCAEVTRPSVLVVENVPRFARWDLYPEWKSCLRKLGYQVVEHLLMATDYGVPQLRQRLFVVGSLRTLALRRQPKPMRMPAFAPHLESPGGGWRPLTESGDDACRRMTEASKRWRKPCLVQHVTGHKGIPLSEPIRTITTKAQWCLVDGYRYRWLTPRELARGMGFPDSFRLPDETLENLKRGIGNAVPPPMAAGIAGAVMEAA